MDELFNLAVTVGEEVAVVAAEALIWIIEEQIMKKYLLLFFLFTSPSFATGVCGSDKDIDIAAEQCWNNDCSVWFDEVRCRRRKKIWYCACNEVPIFEEDKIFKDKIIEK